MEAVASDHVWSVEKSRGSRINWREAALTVKERVRSYLVAHVNSAYCDLCLMKEVGAPERQGVQRATSQLTQEKPATFRRAKVLCSNSSRPGHRVRPKLCIAFLGGRGLPESD